MILSSLRRDERIILFLSPFYRLLAATRVPRLAYGALSMHLLAQLFECFLEALEAI